MSEAYVTIREILGGFIGKTIADISQHDEEDWDPCTKTGSFVMLLFTDGSTLKFSQGTPFIEATDVNDAEDE